MKFELTILGCSAAVPTLSRSLSAQVLNVHDQLFLIDCGEGTQLQMQKFGVKLGRLGHIFISHLHGDHFFGLIGLLTSLSLTGRTEPLTVFAPEGLAEMLEVQFRITYFKPSYPLEFKTIDTEKNVLIYENQKVEVYTIPLCHGIPTCGFLFREKKLLRRMKTEAIKAYNIPYTAIKSLKEGADFVTTEGEVIPNEALTSPMPRTRSYAYCSDTRPHAPIVPLVQGVDILYHEATFGSDMEEHAHQAFHSTARQAAQIAKAAKVQQLIIGHFSSRYLDEKELLEESRKVFYATHAAYDGATYRVAFEQRKKKA